MDRPRDALAEGTELAGYVIGQVLGRGGFGITYAATDALYPDIHVAIKEFLPAGMAVREAGAISVHPASASEAEDFAKALARFQDEARTLVALRHPHIVEAQRFIKANGTAYVVMKLEEGESLGRRLGASGTLPEAELAKILPPLLDGLEAVHARKFLHRDIKPDNIFLRRDGSPVLLDFGAARQAMAGDRKTSLTEIVTPGYAPYEQYDRHSQQGTYTDIYALGATLYRCVTGQKPPDATTRVNAMARKQPDPMPSARTAAKARYAPALLDAIDSSLGVFETDRPQSVAELRALIAPSAPVAAPPSGDTLNLAAAAAAAASAPAASRAVETRPPKAASRHLKRVAAASIGAAVLAGGSYYAWSEYRADQAVAAAKRQAEDARARLDAEIKRRSEEEARKRAEEEARKKAADERRRSEEQAARRKAEEEARRKAEDDRKRAEDEARRKAEEERKRAEDEARKKAEEERARADAERKRQEEERAAEERRREEAEKQRRVELEQAQAELRSCSGQAANWEIVRQACSAVVDGNRHGNDQIAFALARRAEAYIGLGILTAAITDADAALRRIPGYWYAHYMRGRANFDLKRNQEAIRDFSDALQSRREAHIYFYRASSYYYLRDHQRALQDLDQAIQIAPSFEYHGLRGQITYDMGQYARSIQDSSAGIRLNPRDPRLYVNRGNAYGRLAKLDQALQDYNIAIQVGPAFALGWFNRGNYYQHVGNREAALRDFREAARLGNDQARQRLRQLGVQE